MGLARSSTMQPPVHRLNATSGRWGGVVEWLSFLRGFARDPLRTGSIAPSSRPLAEGMVGTSNLRQAKLVVELGPGTGAITAEILPRLGRETRFFAMEIDPFHVCELRRRFPGVCVYAASAERIGAYLDSSSGEGVDCLIACLPWSGMPYALEKSILTAVWDALAPLGTFRFFNYLSGRFLPGSRRFHRLLRGSFECCSAERIVWRNLPPAIIYHCSGKTNRPQ